MEACQGVSKIISDAAKISHPAESRPVKLDDDGIAINNSDKRSTEPRPGPVGCQGNGPQRSAESSIVDQSEYVDAKRGCGSKYKFDDLKDREMAVELEPGISSQQDQSNATTERIKPRVKDTSTNIDEKIARSRIRNGRVPIEERSFSRRHVSSPKYMSYLRTSRKEERDDRLRGNSSSRRNDGIEKSQRRKKLFMESSSIERDGRRNPRIGRRTPMPRSTVHTTYNPITRSSTTPILDSSGLTIQFLRLAVLLYAPTLMPALNSLIAQQNQQTPVSMSSAFERSNDLLTQIFRLLNEQQSIPNLPFVSIESERASSALTAETDVGSSRSLSEKKEENTSIATDKPDSISEQGSSSSGTPSHWKPNDRVQQQNGKNRKWRLTSMLTDSGIRLDKTIFTAEDFRKFEDFLKAKRKRPEDVRSLSMRSKNEVVMKEYFRNWLHRLLQQLNSASSILFKNNEERKFSKIPDKSPLEEVKGQQNRDRLIFDESPNSSKDDGNTFSEREEEDSDDQKSFSSAASTNSSRSLRLKQNDVAEEKESQKNENSQNFDD
ncbi:uncharacterized protein LOC105432054 [Pogonomyrmex barbatus]|uniref:Uncharacterized protein LOC105432054 n=1 Tax=Pogonomyrmex barbatus TaxID=144034 RepID=A0A8N1SBH3_9HYME|nr:uncharacterized protein LOC105432054 [Pogonomyrmex barbatus]